MKSKKKLTKKQLQLKKEKFDKKSNWILISIGLSLVLIIIASWGFQYYKESKSKNAYKQYIGKEVPTDFICMSGDFVKNKPTLPVKIGDKTYQVCCNKCKSKISNTLSYRVAIDPFSKKTIDKSESYVVLNPAKQGEVIYFESFGNYQKYNLLGHD